MAGAWNTWGEAGTQIAGFMFIISMFKQFVPGFISDYFQTLNSRIISYFRREITITFSQYSDSGSRSKVYKTIETYLGSMSTLHAKSLKADAYKKRNLVLTMDDSEEIVDVFQGVVLRWFLLKTESKSKSISWYPSDTVKRAYILTFQANYRELVTNTYLEHVLEVGRQIEAKLKQRKLYTNNPIKTWEDYPSRMWCSLEFNHPATFETLGIDLKLKEEIIFDLTAFRNGKNHYEKIGKAWKRGYLLYGPPGTGKSTMIAAMANYMNYDIYDIELTTVKDNSELRKLLINIGSKSLIVIEDIDCSLDITGERKKKDKNEVDSNSNDPIVEKSEGDGESKVTLSGLLNFIDGLWSSCGGERIIVFTTNHVDKLDPALIRRGRMDKHIELAYCSFEAFKILAKNYLDIESHPLFETIRELLEANKMTPADVVENLTPKSFNEDVKCSLENLIQALEKIKIDKSSKEIAENKENYDEKTKKSVEVGARSSTLLFSLPIVICIVCVTFLYIYK